MTEKIQIDTEKLELNEWKPMTVSVFIERDFSSDSPFLTELIELAVIKNPVSFNQRTKFFIQMLQAAGIDPQEITHIVMHKFRPVGLILPDERETHVFAELPSHNRLIEAMDNSGDVSLAGYSRFPEAANHVKAQFEMSLFGVPVADGEKKLLSFQLMYLTEVNFDQKTVIRYLKNYVPIFQSMKEQGIVDDVILDIGFAIHGHNRHTVYYGSAFKHVAFLGKNF